MMKKTTIGIILLLASIVLFIGACTIQNKDQISEQNPEQQTGVGDNNTIYCTADVQECPDGSFVSRNPYNDCAFGECPEI